MLRHVLLAATIISTPALAETREWRVIYDGTDVGALKAEVEGPAILIDYDYKNNGRGPTMAEQIVLDDKGYPIAWHIEGAATFGNKINESFAQSGEGAVWQDASGPGASEGGEGSFYIPQSSSPFYLGMLGRALLADDDQSIPVLPGGTARLAKHDSFTFEGEGGTVNATVYAVSGFELDPTYIALDQNGGLFAVASDTFAVIRAGYEDAADKPLREYAEKLSTDRFVEIQKETAHQFDGPVRITNVFVFDPKTMARSGPVSVLWNGDRIAAVEPSDEPATAGETVFDGGGGTLVPGMYEMHGHISQDEALLNIAAGVTSVRDMGNSNEVLDGLIERIADGTIAGPRITRSGFIEGKSPFSANNGIVVATEEEALDAVRWYGARGYYQVKLYNSMTPEWAPALATEAHRLGMKVTGHVPAFSNADAMIDAGFDEMTHINQVMLGWVLEEGEDTRSLLRLTAMDRLPALDLNGAKVQSTIQHMVDKGVGIDPTITIHESLLLGRNGEISPGFVDIYDHMPVAEQRSLKQAWSDVSAPGQDEKYRGAYDQIIKTLSMMKDRGILIVPGTDMGGSFAYHRELQLFEKIGYSAPEVLRLATLGMAEYLGQDQELGSIERGKLADFFLVPGDPTADLAAIKAISMVVANGTAYFPGEIYENFGITPFADAPDKVTSPAAE